MVWNCGSFGSQYSRAIEFPERLDYLPPPALLRDRAFRDLYGRVALPPVSPRFGFCAYLCCLLLFRDVLSQLEVSAVSPTFFPRFLHPQPFWRQMLSLRPSEMERN
jgi:hypothetical protein